MTAQLRLENVFATAHTIGARQQLAYYAGRVDDVFRVVVLTYDAAVDAHMFVNMDFADREGAQHFLTAYKQDPAVRQRFALALDQGYDAYKGERSVI